MTEEKKKKLQQHKHKVLHVVFGRTFMLVSSLLLQLLVLLYFMLALSDYLSVYYWLSIVVGVVMLSYILNREVNSAYKLAWSIPVAVFPVFGTLFYLFVHLQTKSTSIKHRLENINTDFATYTKQDALVINDVKKVDLQVARLAEYMNHAGNFPICDGSDAKFYPLGDDWYPDFLKRLQEAKEFIFIEFFIVDLGECYYEVMEILKKKAMEGVEVRFMYDGTCTFFRLPSDFPDFLKQSGIQCRIYQPIKPVLTPYQNYRDHRKIVVIDGKYAYTGGVNLADEYMNRIVRFGHWKDTAVELTGKVVDSYTIMFLQLWNISSGKTENIDRYIKRYEVPSTGYIMGYSDSPFDKERIGETVYLDMLYTAVDYVHITTPYLILDQELITALAYAVKRGVDVKIITPHITDKPFIYMVSRVYYERLIKLGVEIYEYTPGFIHAKEFISDDKKAVIGSVNLDYRSLYLNFETAAYLYGVHAVCDAERDFEETLKKSQQITILDCNSYSFVKRILGRMMWLFAPLL